MYQLAQYNVGQLDSPTGYSATTTTDFGLLLNNIFGMVVVVGGILLIAYLLFGAFKYITAGGDDKAVQSAKKMMTGAGAGIMIMVAAFLITQILGLVLGGDAQKFLTFSFTGPGGAEQYGAVTSPFSGYSDVNSTSKLISNFFGLATIGAGLGLLVYLILGGFKFVTSGGDSKAADSAKAMMTNAVIGLIIVVAVYFIVGIVGKVLGINILQPTIPTP